MSVLADLLTEVLLALPLGPGRGRDRRLLREGRARCAIRSIEGRVLNIGTEWSAGTCSISTGRILFSPTIGIVGDRDIEVLEVLSGDVDPDENVLLGEGPTVTFIVRTPRGDLYWALPAFVAKGASALLFAVEP
jgi:hypothetical protein